jgi:beta-glucosidase
VVRDGRVDPDTLAGTWKGGVGGAVHDFYPHSANETNYIQQWVKQNSRLGIPVLFIEECLHGLQQAGHTGAIRIAHVLAPIGAH